MIVSHVPPAAPAPAVEVAHHCPKGSRNCFPHDRVGVVSEDDRGSGRAWYELRLGGWEPITYPDGTVNKEYAWERLTVPVPAGLSFAETMATLRATAAAHRPGMELLNSWATEEPADEF